MISAGLTGGIGSGKSTVAAMFRALGAVTINSDEIGRSLMQPGNVVYDRIVSGFGSTVVNDKGQLDRQKLAEIVFNDLDKLKHLNAIVHDEPVLGFDLTGYWSDIGTPERYAQAERDVANKRISLAARNDASPTPSPIR